MSSLTIYLDLARAGAPVTHLGAVPICFYTDRVMPVVHGDPTCSVGATNETVTLTVDALTTQQRPLCYRCGTAVVSLALEPLRELSLRHARLTDAARLTGSARTGLARWHTSRRAAEVLLKDLRKLRETVSVLEVILDELSPAQAGQALVDWVAQIAAEATAALADAATAIRADPATTSLVTGLPVDGPLRWVLLETVRYLLQTDQIPAQHQLALVAYWPHRGATPARVDEQHRLLVAVPQGLAERLMAEDPDTAKMYRRRRPGAGVDAGPVVSTDTEDLPGLALRLLSDARPGDPLWEPAAAVTAARGILAA